MDPSTGQTVLHYRLVEKIGEGGMGVVWKALDPGLDRSVAIKILPATFAADVERLARFEREAKLLASLNHPNIASVYGLHRADGIHFIAMELVAGENLATRLRRGPTPLPEAIEIGRQVADALEAAHERGVVHRDLKPANVQVLPDGQIKVLDFGLAKVARDEDGGDESASLVTASSPMSGVVLGTAAYMSPEQARGQPADRRADVWAFGCLLFEMLCGQRPFEGETVSDTIAAVLRSDPDWSVLPADLPRPIANLVRRCLTKNVRRRLRDIGEARIALEDGLADGTSAPAPAGGATSGRPPWLLRGVAALGWAAVAALVAVHWTSTDPAPAIERWQVQLHDREPLWLDIGTSAVLSPDGRRVAFVAGHGAERSLYVREVDSPTPRKVDQSEGARAPFFSPDGDRVGFFTDDRLWNVAFDGGTPVELAETGENRGGAWGPDGTIVFAADTTSGLSRISADGGPVTALTATDGPFGSSHRYPDFSPDGRVVVYSVRKASESFDQGNIEAVSLATGRRETLLTGGYLPRVAPTGHLTFVREGTIFAVPLDLDRLVTTGPPVPVLEGVHGRSTYGGAQYSFAQDGTLLYVEGVEGALRRRLVWVDRDGRREPLPFDLRDYQSVALSPDATHAVAAVFPTAGTVGSTDLWVLDLEREVSTRLTFEEGVEYSPIWSPDGESVVYARNDDDRGWAIEARRVDGAGEPDVLLRRTESPMPFGITPDGRTVLFVERSDETDLDIWAADLDGDEPTATPIVRSPFTESMAQLSPDGRFLAYGSNESGANQLYVRSFPVEGGKWQISTDGLTQIPRWSSDGRELFWLHGESMMRATIETVDGTVRAGRPVELFRGPFFTWGTATTAFDVASNGKRLLMMTREGEDTEDAAGPARAFLVRGWFRELHSRTDD